MFLLNSSKTSLSFGLDGISLAFSYTAGPSLLCWVHQSWAQPLRTACEGELSLLLQVEQDCWARVPFSKEDSLCGSREKYKNRWSKGRQSREPLPGPLTLTWSWPSAVVGNASGPSRSQPLDKTVPSRSHPVRRSSNMKTRFCYSTSRKKIRSRIYEVTADTQFGTQIMSLREK